MTAEDCFQYIVEPSESKCCTYPTLEHTITKYLSNHSDNPQCNKHNVLDLCEDLIWVCTSYAQVHLTLLFHNAF
jgi:hypothetical protein